MREGRGSPSLTIKKTRFGKIMTGLRLGAAHCFDEEAYNGIFQLEQGRGSIRPLRTLRHAAEGTRLLRSGLLRVSGKTP